MDLMEKRALPETINRLPLRVNPRRIGYLKFILEGYDGMAVVTTLDAKEGDIVLRYPSSFHNELTAIINDVSTHIY